MEARNRVGIGFSYRPTRLHRLAESDSLQSVHGLLKSLIIRAQRGISLAFYSIRYPSESQWNGKLAELSGLRLALSDWELSMAVEMTDWSGEIIHERKHFRYYISFTYLPITVAPLRWKITVCHLSFCVSILNAGRGGRSHFTEFHIYDFKVHEYCRKFFSMAGWSFNGFVR